MPDLKTARDVPELVRRLMEASPDVCAIGDVGYCIIDCNRPDANAEIERILDDFGPRDHLYFEIIDCFRENGRVIEIESPKLH